MSLLYEQGHQVRKLMFAVALDESTHWLERQTRVVPGRNLKIGDLRDAANLTLDSR